MVAAIAANEACRSDAAGRFLLDGLSARLRRLIAALERDLARPLGGPFGTAGRWGPNGRGPEIEDLIRRSALARLPMPEAEPRPTPASRAARSSLHERMTMPCPTETERSFLYSTLIATPPRRIERAPGGGALSSGRIEAAHHIDAVSRSGPRPSR